MPDDAWMMRKKALAILRHPQHSGLTEHAKRELAAEMLGINRRILDRLLDES